MMLDIPLKIILDRGFRVEIDPGYTLTIYSPQLKNYPPELDKKEYGGSDINELLNDAVKDIFRAEMR